MFTGFETRKCIRCGKTFNYMAGGIILQLPVCPECSSRFSIKLPSFFRRKPD